MNITILFFGMLAEETHTSILELNTASRKLRELENEVLNLFPVLKNLTYGIAVNEIIVQNDVKLSTGSKVAFLPPFAGG
jgi:molybdopterin converting factor small subunit